MTALTEDRNPGRTDDKTFDDDAAASVECFVGGLVSIDTSGNARPGRADVTDRVRGVCTKHADNSSGSAGDIKVHSEAGTFPFANSGGGDEITSAEVGSTCYVVDDNTVAKTSNSSTRPAAGRVVRVRPDGRVDVQVGEYRGGDGDLVAANDLSDVNDAATARDSIGANVHVITRSGMDLTADGTYYIPCPPSGLTITEIRTAVEGATTATGAPDVVLNIDGTPVTDSDLVVAIGTTVGTQDSNSPSAANVAVDGENIEIEITVNGQDAASTLSVTIEGTY